MAIWTPRRAICWRFVGIATGHATGGERKRGEGGERGERGESAGTGERERGDAEGGKGERGERGYRKGGDV